MHYKTIKFNIKIPLNIHNFHFCGKFYIATLRAVRADFFFFFFFLGGGNYFFYLLPPPPPPPNPKNGSTPLEEGCISYLLY